MTIGADTDYFLPSDREPKNFHKLSTEQLEVVRMVREQIADSDDLDRMRDAAANLNDVFAADGLLGQSATLQSESSTVISRGVNYQASSLEIDKVLEIVSGEKHEGVFVGCDVIPLNSMTPELVYLLELPMVTKGLRFRTAVAAVDDAELMIDAEAEGMGESLELLSQVRSDIVTRNLRIMGELKNESQEVVDSDYLKEMALLAIEILAQPEIAKSKKLTDAVAEIFSELIDGAVRYAFEGFDVERVERAKGLALAVNQIEALGYVHTVTTVEDFEYIPAADGKEASAIVSKTLQPAFVFMGDGKAHVVPIRYLSLFYVDRLSDKDSRCDSARERFLSEYPDVFHTPSKIKKITNHILKKYFQNEEGGV